jgi:hypothetical protein
MEFEYGRKAITSPIEYVPSTGEIYIYLARNKDCQNLKISMYALSISM